MVHTKWIGCWWKQVRGGLARSPSSQRERLQRPQPGMTWRYNSVVINWPFPSDTRLLSILSVAESPRCLQKKMFYWVLRQHPGTEEKVSLRCPQERLKPLWRYFTRMWEWKRAYWRRFHLELKKKKTIKICNKSGTQKPWNGRITLTSKRWPFFLLVKNKS